MVALLEDDDVEVRQSAADGLGLLRELGAWAACCQNSKSTRELPMSSTFDTIANIIAETCDIPRDSIKPESHAINDLGIDSLDFLDIAFAIDKAFGIKLPLEQWTQKEQTQAEVKVFILDHMFQALPSPPFTEAQKEAAADRAYRHIWQQCASGLFPVRRAA